MSPREKHNAECWAHFLRTPFGMLLEQRQSAEGESAALIRRIADERYMQASVSNYIEVFLCCSIDDLLQRIYVLEQALAPKDLSDVG